ncbi:MAG: P-loop NTPase [Pseudomonadota bacterium]
MEKQKNITAIIGPKGGVGKTTISANLAIALSQTGKRVIALDLDLGASNLHAVFGIRDSKYTLDDFVQNRVKNLADIVLDTDIPNVRIICGGDIPGIANMSYQKKMKLIRHIAGLDGDFVILDLAPGAAYNVADFSIIAQKSLLVTTPEVPSLMNVYGFIKSALFRRLNFIFKYKKSPELLELLETARAPDNHPDLKTMEGFFQKAFEIDSAVAASAKKNISNFKPFVLVNRVRTKKDARAGEVIQNIMKQYLSIECTMIMTIREDEAVGDSIARLKPIMIHAPDSPFSMDLKEIAARLCP